MNNKGFAITGILYTVFILFILTLFAVLSGLNTRERLMKKSIKSIEKNFVYNSYVNVSDSYGNIALEDGLYFFNDVSGNSCYSYLKKGTKFSDAVFIKTSNDDSCEYRSDFVVNMVYKSSNYNDW